MTAMPENRGRLIVIDGLDGSGKSTQFDRLTEYYRERNRPLEVVSFPDYDSDSSALVKMYLRGDFGTDPMSVNEYAASAFYAVDRFASYRMKWEKPYLAGKTILAARYTTSNAIHQMSKLPPEKWDSFLSWLCDFEFDKLGLPRPDHVLFLDMPVEVSAKLLSHRYCGDENKKDIHERDEDYLLHCRAAALYAAEKLGWSVIPCSNGENPLSPDVIFQSILSKTERDFA